MPLRAPSLEVVVATFVLALAAGCSSAPDIPGSGLHSSSGASSGGSGGSGGSGSSGSSGGAASSSGGSGSGSSSGAGGSGGGTIADSETWADGQTLPGSVTIAAGGTVTIAPGATVNVPAGAVIKVEGGTLTASSASPTHAKLTGNGWGGIVVASGGTMTLDGVDLAGVTASQAAALDVQKGATRAEYDDGIIDAATTPFQVEAGGALGLRHVTVTKAGGSSIVDGALTAQFLDYDSNGHEGIGTSDPTAVLSIEDSKLHGSGPVADMIVSSGAASIHVAYTDITSVHCGFHFNDVTKFDVSYSNIESNAWGFMLYGSTNGGTVSYSNVDQNSSYAYDEEGTNGPITFDHCYVSGNVQQGTVSVTNAQSSAVAGTGPRAN